LGAAADGGSEVDGLGGSHGTRRGIEHVEIAVIEQNLSSQGPDDLGLRLPEAKYLPRDPRAHLSRDRVR
jgi:hypothetical protein